MRDRQVLLAVEVEEGTTARQAIERSGILRQFPRIDLARAMIGVFGKSVALETRLRDGDRVEIYRALTVDPKQARRERARRS